MWTIINTTSGQHIGTRISHVEPNQVLTFENGDVVPILQVFTADEGRTLLACGKNYQITFSKED